MTCVLEATGYRWHTPAMAMLESALGHIVGGQVVLPCDDLDTALAYFTTVLGFRLDAIHPADAPTVAVLSGHGLCVRLDCAASGDPGVLRLARQGHAIGEIGDRRVRAPNGTVIELVDADAPYVLPPLQPSLVVNRAGAGVPWHVGRAGMRYRDLIPDRQGGRFIASHISIPDGGPVPDYVHYHAVRFQMIYCYRGWVRLVYEDQGPSFVMHAGDCVIQPPQIRHRVLEASDGLEVIEIGCPAEHETLVEHVIDLPTDSYRPDRSFDGQRFVWHRAAEATWTPWCHRGFRQRDTGIADVTGGLAGARVVRATGDGVGAGAVDGARAIDGTGTASDLWVHDGELAFSFVLDGEITLVVDGAQRPATRLHEGDTVVVPAGLGYRFDEPSEDFELLDVTLPG